MFANKRDKVSCHITSGRGILSRKIRSRLIALFFVLIGVFQPVLSGSIPVESTPLMAVDQLRTLPRQDVVVIDTRSFVDFFSGHIPGAVNLNDWREFSHERGGVPGMLIEDREFIAEKLRLLGLDYGKTIVVYGEPKDPWRTDGRFFWMFQHLGFEKVSLLEGGFDLWVQKGGSVERGRGKPMPPSSLSPSDIRFNPNVIADQGWIFKRLGSPALALIDNREQKEFDGATPYGSVRGGHIPGAIHIDWRNFFTGQGVLKNRATLDALLESHGIRADQDIVVYCTGGVRSGMAYFVFKYLGFDVRNYDGSWWDWSRNLSLPVAR